MDLYDLIKQGRIKRYFRATRKLNHADIVSHLTQRAAGGEPLFLEDDDYLFMIGLLKEISDSHALRIYSFCLMPNHLHLLLSPGQDNLSRAMQGLFSKYAMRFNNKFERKGHLFGGPYRQAVCLDNTYLLAASIYIHLNPVRAGLVEAPNRYRWSSCRLYCGNAKVKSFVDKEMILSLLSGDPRGARNRYKELLYQGGKEEIADVSEQRDAVEEFSLRLAGAFPHLFEGGNAEKAMIKTSGPDILSLDQIERRIGELRPSGGSTKPEAVEARRYLVEQLVARGFKKEEIAARLGLSRKTIYNVLRNK